MELARSPDAFQIALECITDPVLVVDYRSRRILAVNDRAGEAYGYSRDELVRMAIEDLHPLSNRSCFETPGEHGDGVEHREVWRRVRRNGEVADVQIAARRVVMGETIACFIRSLGVVGDRGTEPESVNAIDLLRAVTDACDDALFAKDQQGRYLLFNRAAERFVGQKADEVIGRDDTALFDSAGARRVMERDREVLLTGETRIEEERLTAAGVTRTYLATKAPYCDEQGNVVGVIGISRDVTRQKKAEQDLRLSEERYRTLVEAITAMAWNTPESGEFETEQAGWSSFTGQTFEQLKGWGWLNAVHPEDRSHTAKGWATAIASRTVYVVEHRLRRADGAYRWMAVRAVPILYPDGSIREWVGIHTDVTEQRLADDALKESEAKLAEALRVARMGYWNQDVDSGEIEWSAELYKIFGITNGSRSVTLIDLLAIVHQDDRLAVKQRIAQAVANGDAFEHTYRIVVDGKIKSISEFGRVILSPEGKAVRITGTVQDVTERLRVEENLRSSEERLQHAIVNAPFPAMVHAEGGEVLMISNAWTELTGFTLNDIPTVQDWARKAYGDQAGVNAVVIAKLYAITSRQHTGEFRVFSASGETLTWDFWATPLGALPDGRRMVLSMAVDVTEQRRAAQELQASELRFRQVVENQTEVVSRCLPDGTVTFVNEATCRLFGETAEQLVGRKWFPAAHPDDLPRIEAGLREMSITNPVVTIESRVYDAEGTIHWFEVVNRGFFGQAGELVQFQSVGRDVTDRRQMEAALRESESRFRAVFNSTFQFIGVLALDGTLLEVNETALVAGGLQEADVVGKPFWETRWWIDSATARQTLQESIARAAQGEFIRYEVDVRGPGESILTIDFSIKPVVDDSGSIALLIPEGRDITEHKAAEQALKLRDRAVRAISQGIVITDSMSPDDPIVYVNPGFEAITGYESSEIIGQNCRFLHGPESDTQTVRAIELAVRNGTQCTVEILNYRSDGTPFWNTITLSPVRDEEHRLTHIVWVQVDSTERKDLEDRLRQSEKMEAIGQLAGGVAHDFNNMLAVINGYSSRLARSDNLNEGEREAIDEIRTAGQRAAGLTRQLLAFSRKQVLKPMIVDLNETIVEMESMLSRLIGEDIRIRTLLDSSLWQIRIDPGQLEQIIMNLAINSRDAMPDGGVLTIETGNTECDGERRDVSPGRYVRFSVNDTGGGMDEAVRDRIFEPFFTTKDQGKGTGLGLASVYGIVKQSGGQISVESAPGRGATFTILFPAFETERRREARTDAESANSAGGAETILVVEDEEMVRRLFCKVLSDQGYAVLGAGSGIEALAQWDQRRDDIDLVITDVVMPEMSGRQLADRLRESKANLKVLFMSGYTDDAVIRHHIEEKAVYFIQKPFLPTALATKVREVLAADS